MDISLVYSNEFKFRLLRHIAFWIVILSYHWAVDFIVPTFFEGVSYNVAADAFWLGVVYLPGQLILVYGMLYIVVPRFLDHSDYVIGIFLALLFCLLAGYTNEMSYRFWSEVENLVVSGKHSLGMHRILGTVGVATCIKFMKYWYEKKFAFGTLEREKLTAELQTLKAQLHPHFLFNTLNNIYSITETVSPQASDMLHRLSAMLRYILYECNKPEILLSQEFKIINDYIALESIRYSRELDITMQLPEQSSNQLIAPLLLLPLIENCFKHGTRGMLDQAWINIKADLKENTLHIKLINGKSDRNVSEGAHGIGLSNVKKRLELLYPDRHELKVLPEENLFVVSLKLELRNTDTLKKNEQVR